VIPQVGNVGIGVEFAMAPNWTVKAEYLYEFITANRVDFRSPGGTNFGFGTRTMYHIGRVGLNYRFGGTQPGGVLD
jgi:outer membrane immunogenic protein